MGPIHGASAVDTVELGLGVVHDLFGVHLEGAFSVAGGLGLVGSGLLVVQTVLPHGLCSAGASGASGTVARLPLKLCCC